MISSICYIIPQLEVGGAEKYVLELASIYSKKSMKIHIISFGRIDWRYVESFKLTNCSVKILETKRIFSFSSAIVILKLIKYFTINKISLIHLNLRKADIIGGIAAIISKRKFLSTQHDTLPWRYSNNIKDIIYKYLHRFIMKYVQVIIAPTYSVKRYLVETEKIPCHRIKVIFHGIHLNEFPPKPKEINDEIIIGSLAKLRPEKGHIYMIKAMPKILEKLKNKSIKLLIAGDGSAKDMLQDEVKKSNLTECVKFLGRVYEVQHFIENINILLLTPISEAFCYAILEGMAMGKAVVATDVNGISEIIQHGRNGLLIPAASADAIAKTIVELVLDKNLYNKLVSNASTDCRPYFSIERMASETYQLYTSTRE